MRTSSFKDQWDKQRQNQDAMRREGKAVLVILKGGSPHLRLHVIAPENREFAEGARKIGGAWKYRSQVWSFDMAVFWLVKRLCTKVYSKVEVAGLVHLIPQ